MKNIFAAFLFLVLLNACGGRESKPEVVDKLRGLGVLSSPVVAKASTTSNPEIVRLTFYATVPKGKKITSTPFDDVTSSYSVPVPNLEIVAGSENVEPHSAFDIYSVQAQFVVPTSAVIKLDTLKSVRLRYALKMEYPGEEERIIGDVIVRPDNSEELKWRPPEVNITEPANSMTVSKNSKTNIKAEVTDHVGEDLKVAWFVSHGEIDNRRSRNTKWKTGDAAEQTLVVALHGKKSRSFALKAIDLKTN